MGADADLELNDLLEKQGLDPEVIVVLRHRPHEPRLRKVLPWLAAEKPDVYNAFQQTQSPRLESTMAKLVGSGYIASFIGHEPGRALFVGIYSIKSSRPVSYEEYWRVPAYVEMKKFGMLGYTREDVRDSQLWFDLALTDFYADWKGRLVIDWPPPERSWWRRAHRNSMPILSILESSALDKEMPEWAEIVLSWEELKLLPKAWRAAISQWRGIYYIYDIASGKGYVGSAYGKQNICGRWMRYAADGHGGDKLLKRRDPKNFRFSILQRVSPDMVPEEVIRLEEFWKERLHTRAPQGLNQN